MEQRLIVAAREAPPLRSGVDGADASPPGPRRAGIGPGDPPLSLSRVGVTNIEKVTRIGPLAASSMAARPAQQHTRIREWLDG